jgi:CRP/FNR family transcriptional regulator
MKFAARDGSSARTLAVTRSPSQQRAAQPSPRPRASAPGAHLETRSASAQRAGIGAAKRLANGGNGGAANVRARAQRQTTVNYRKGDDIFTPGHGGGLVFIVRSGCVRLYKVLPDGRSINLGLLGPNTLFTQEESYDGLSTGATAEALTDATLSVVESEDLAGLIAESPDLASAVVTGMTRRITELQTLVEQLLARDTSVRLATTLLALATRFGRPTADGMLAITLPLTHQSIANMIGSNRVTVTRKLLELQEDGAVRSLGRNALAVNTDVLRRHAQPTSPER